MTTYQDTLLMEHQDREPKEDSIITYNVMMDKTLVTVTAKDVGEFYEGQWEEDYEIISVTYKGVDVWPLINPWFTSGDFFPKTV